MTKPSGKGGCPWKWLIVAVYGVYNCHSCSIMFYDMRIKAWKQVCLPIHTSSFSWPHREYLQLLNHGKVQYPCQYLLSGMGPHINHISCRSTVLILMVILMPTLITMAKADCMLMAHSRPHRHHCRLLLLMSNIQHNVDKCWAHLAALWTLGTWTLRLDYGLVD